MKKAGVTSLRPLIDDKAPVFFKTGALRRLRRLCRRAERHEKHSLTARRCRDLLVIFEAAVFTDGLRPG